MNRLLISILLMCTTLFEINCENKKCEIITVTNELSYCEESQVFCKIIDSANELHLEKRNISTTVFLKFKTGIKENNRYYYHLFFPSFPKKRYKAILLGKFSSSKLMDDTYGCLGSSIFEVTKVISFEDVTKSDTFQINYFENN
jgi:hypothetical protein